MAASSKKVVIAALCGNGAIAITKFVASYMTGSSAMFSEGIHSVADTGNQALMLYGLAAAAQPPDDDHPFGYGKELYFWSFVVAMMLFAIGSGVSLYEGIRHLAEALGSGHGHGGGHGSVMVNYVVLGVSFLFEMGACYVAFKEFNKARGDLGFFEAVRVGKDPSLFVVLFEDIGAGLGLIIAFLGVLLTDVTGLVYFDYIASIMIGLLLGVTALWLAYETKGLLVGEAARDPIEDGIGDLLREFDAILKINELTTLHMGPNTIVLTASVDFDDEHEASAIEETVTAATNQIRDEYPRVKRVFLEAESWKSHGPPTEAKTPHE